MSTLNDSQYQLIERFFKGELNPEELKTFDNLMVQEKEFKATVMLQNELRKSLEQKKKESPLMQIFEEEAQKIQHAHPPEKSIQPEGESWWNWIQSWLTPQSRLAYAFGVIVLLLFSSIWWAHSNFSNESILATLHEPILDNTQAGVPTDAEILNKGKKAFFENDFPKAERLLLSVSPDDEKYFHEAQALLAYTYFRNNNFGKSITQFNLLIDDYFNKLPAGYQNQNKLRWTRLLAYFGLGQEREPFFKKELEFFQNNNSEVYRKKAKQLQSKIDSPWRRLVFK